MYRRLALAGVVALLAACSDPQQTPTDKLSSLPVDPDARQLEASEVSAQQTGTYNITLRILPGTPASVENALRAGASRWERVITTGVRDVRANISAGSCGSNPSFSGTIDDILVFAGTASIDGPGGILAQAGPCRVRSGSGFPFAGVLIFDSADVAGFASQLELIAVHELGHDLGIGTIWDLKGLLVGGGGSNPVFVGPSATAEWNRLGGSGPVPVENTGGPGTRDGHWRESVFGNELMTGFLNSGFNPLSRVTAGSLGDLGYRVNLGAADPYSLPSGAVRGQDLLEFETDPIVPTARAD